MLETLFLILKDLPKGVITIIVAALPVSELRGAIPLALLTLKEPLAKAVFLSVVGNLIPVVPLLLFFEPLSEKFRRFKIWRIFFDHLFERTRRKAQLIQKYQAMGLALFVAVPLPLTGAWTGCIAAALFKIKFRYAFWAIVAGVCIAAVIVTGVTLLGRGIFFHLFLVH